MVSSRKRDKKRALVRVPHDGRKFKIGNQVSVGNASTGAAKAVRNRVLTQTLISKLHELDPKTGKEKYYTLIDKLYDLAIAKEGGLQAIMYIFDRVDGKIVQQVTLGDETGAPFEFSLKIGHAGSDGSKTAAEVHLRPSVAIPEADDGDL
jgi:hypothetical protein